MNRRDQFLNGRTVFWGVTRGQVELVSTASWLIVLERVHHATVTPIMHSRNEWERSSIFGPVTKAAPLDALYGPGLELLLAAGDSRTGKSVLTRKAGNYILCHWATK